MGTRSLTYVYDGPLADGDIEQQPIVCMYRQYDGYPSGHGQELAEFLGNTQITNGYGADQKAPAWANGMGCLAAQVVAHFKDGVGGVYLEAPQLNKDSGQEYEYHVYTDEQQLMLKIMDIGFAGPNVTLFDGPMADALAFCLLPPEGE